jgi:circadian clock protein KaiC
VLKLRGTKFVGGYHDFSIETGGIVVYPRLVAAESRPEFQRTALSSGITGLDALLGGGLEAGTTTLMMGPAGTGKSILAAQYLFEGVEQGKRGSYFIFDEVRSTLLVRTARLGIDLEKHVQAGPCTVRRVDPAELSPGEFSHLVRQSVEHNQAAVVVIDSVNGYQQAMPEEHFLAAYMHELVSYLSQRGVVTVLILGQHGLLDGNVSPPVNLSYLVDTVLLLRYFETAGEVRRAISVVKKRTGPHERAIREFSIGAEGVRIGEPLQQFRGVLTGSPQYVGESIPMSGEDNDGPAG